MSTSINDYTSFACPNINCKLHGCPNQGNITHHSWIGKDKHIERLRCLECKKAFSENKNTLRERAKIKEEQQILLLKCFRWGVCDEGAADISEVNLKTVGLFRSKVAEHAKTHHECQVKDLDAPGIQMDEIRAKQKGSITWAAVAMLMNTYLIVAVACGKRSQSLADVLFAEVWGRCRRTGIFLTDGWRCYYSALMRCFGKFYRPRKAFRARGRKLGRRLKLARRVFYGQVVKQTEGRFKLCAVSCRAILGTMSQCLFFIKVYEFGEKIHTAHIERWFGNLRSCVAGLRRKSRCLRKNPLVLRDQVWIYVALHNWVLPHTSLSAEGLKRTPAMAAGIADHVFTYKEFIRLQVFSDLELRMKIRTKLAEMQAVETIKAYKRTKHPKPEEETIWKLPPKKRREDAA